MRNSGNVRKSKPHVFHCPESFMNMKFNDEKISQLLGQLVPEGNFIQDKMNNVIPISGKG